MLSKSITVLKRTYFQVGIVATVFVGFYYPFIVTMINDWNENDNYCHGYLIPFISVYMIFSCRRKLEEVDITPNNWGLLVIAIGLVQLVVAKIGSEFFLQRTSMIIVLFGLSLFLLGKELTKRISVPVLYLVFMIPIPAIIWFKLALPMKLLASILSEWSIGAMGIPVLREGNILHLAECSLEVVDACSGLRSLVSMLAISAALAYLSKNTCLRKWLLFLSAIPIAISVNIVRVTVTAGLANRFGEEVANGFLHGFSGWLLFTLGIMMLISVYVVLSKNSIKPNVSHLRTIQA